MQATKNERGDVEDGEVNEKDYDGSRYSCLCFEGYSTPDVNMPMEMLSFYGVSTRILLSGDTDFHTSRSPTPSPLSSALDFHTPNNGFSLEGSP